MRIDAVAIAAGNVARAQHELDAVVRVCKGVQIAQLETRAGVRRAHDAHPQCIGRRLVSAEHFRAVNLARAVYACEPRADRGARLDMADVQGLVLRTIGLPERHDRFDDLLIARAAA